MAKNQLEAGIACFISNENRPYGPISGGVRLHVRQQDLEAAQQIFSEHSSIEARCTRPSLVNADLRLLS